MPTHLRNHAYGCGDEPTRTITSAEPPTPSSSSGQGAAQAAESAIELARCLRDLPTAEAASGAYEWLRRPRVELISRAAAKTSHAKAGKATRAAA